MYWTVGKTSSETEDDKSFVSEFLELKDWNVTAECTVMLNETHMCSKNLEITVYRNPELFLYPTKPYYNCVEGMLCELQCDIVDVAPVQNLTVRWYKDKKIIRTDTFPNTVKLPVHESSSLILNASRGDHGAQFRCEAQLDFGPHGAQTPVTSQTHNVSVLYAPMFKGNTVSDYFYYPEGSNISVNCEAEGNPPPVFGWTRDGVDLSEKSDHLNLTLMKDSAIYNCTASNSQGSITKQISVYVTKPAKIAAPAVTTTTEASTTTATEVPTSTAPQTSAPTHQASVPTTPQTSAPTTHQASAPKGCPLVLTPAEIVVKFGDPASVNCSTSTPDADFIGWEATLGGTGASRPPVVTWRVEKLTQWTIEPKCFLTKTNNEQCTVMPAVTIYKTPDMVLVSGMASGVMVEGRDFLLTCHVINVAPVQNLKVKWYRGNKTVHTQRSDITNPTSANETFTWWITPKRDYNGMTFRCKAELHLSGPELVPTMISSPYTANVHYPPFFEEKSDNLEVTSGENVTLDCRAKGNPLPKIHWNYPPAVNVRETTGGRQSNIRITGATSTNDGVYICNATNDIGTVTRSVRVVIKRQTSGGFPWFMWAVLFLSVLIVIIIITKLILHSHKKKNGQYSFVSNNASNNIMMTEA